MRARAARRYYKSTERRGREMDMYPPGRVMFIRPLKTLVGRRGPGRRSERGWDTVWVTPQELIAEGILISGKARRRCCCRAHAPACMHVPVVGAKDCIS
jgi:hypothetical protein